MTKRTVAKYIVVIAKSTASDKFLFVRNNKGEWAFPMSKQGLLDTHPIVRAVKSSIGVFGDITNIEIMFEISGEECLVIVYQTLFEFDKSISRKSIWANPLSMIGTGETDEMTESIIEAMVQAFTLTKDQKPTKSQPLEFKIK